MSTVSASSNNLPQLQVWKRGQTQSGGAAQGDAPSQSFAPTSQQTTNTPSSLPAPQAGAKAATSAGTFPRFEPQTLQTLLALQQVK
jgi:hypothetical protein